MRGLTEPDVARLVEASAGVAARPSVVASLRRETEGNPLFVQEVVRLLVDEGRLEAFATEPIQRLRMPQSVRGVIERRLDRLSEACNSVLTLASVIGRDFGLDALERVSAVPRAKLFEVL